MLSCSWMCAHLGSHTHTQWQTPSHTQTHSSLFSDKGLLLQLCHDSTKDFFSRKRGLNRDLAGDWAKNHQHCSPSRSFPHSLSLISPPPHPSLFPSLTSSRSAAFAGRQSFTSLFRCTFVELCGGSASVLCGLMIRVLELQRGWGLGEDQAEREQHR